MRKLARFESWSPDRSREHAPNPITMKTFEDIVTGRTDCHKVFEDEYHLAFLNRSPIVPGHTIVIPKRVWPYLFDMDAHAYHELWETARRVARHIQASLPCERVCVAVVGWEVRHAHIHLVPTDRTGQFPPLPGQPASTDELDRVLKRLAIPA